MSVGSPSVGAKHNFTVRRSARRQNNYSGDIHFYNIKLFRYLNMLLKLPIIKRSFSMNVDGTQKFCAFTLYIICGSYLHTNLYVQCKIHLCVRFICLCLIRSV